MEKNFREFRPGNAADNGNNNTQQSNKKSGGGLSFGRGIGLIALVIVIALLIFESVYSIGEQEQGVVTTFGKAGSVVTSGLHFKIPFITLKNFKT